MLGIIIKILSIIGIILLILLATVIALFLLVLLFPVSYEASGEKSKDAMRASVKARWLFGILRARYDYPEPGRFVVKLLWINILDSESQKSTAKKEDRSVPVHEEANTSPSDIKQVEVSEDNIARNNGDEEESEKSPLWEKIIYTIRKICDKIKDIYETVTYYIGILKEEDTKELLAHILYRMFRILKSIRPLKIAGTLQIGTGSPDTTGYIMALYGMLSPHLGKNLSVTPNFEDKILEGNLYIKGHITLGVLVYHMIRVVLDRRLRVFIKKIKREVR